VAAEPRLAHRAGHARLLAGRAPKWLVADSERGRYVFVNPSDEVSPLWLETPRTVVECEAFGFGRVSIDEPRGEVAIEADVEIGGLRLRSASELHLIINGRDVTALLGSPDAEGVRELPA
jgi:hypothetical protein